MSNRFIRRANVVAGGNNSPAPSRLPTGYTELAYLQSDGNQYIDTGIIPTASIDVFVDLQLLATTTNKYIFGKYTSSAQYYLYCASASGSPRYQFGWSCSYLTTSTEVDTDRHSIRLYSDGTYSYLYIDSTQVSKRSTADQSGNTYSFTLFKGGSPAIASSLPHKVWSCKMTNVSTQEVLLELVPAKRDSDDVVGMYDMVSDTFLTNAGSGTFSYGTL